MQQIITIVCVLRGHLKVIPGNKNIVNLFLLLLTVDERSSDSYVGRDGFFRKSLKTCSGSNLIFVV